MKRPRSFERLRKNHDRVASSRVRVWLAQAHDLAIAITILQWVENDC